MRIRKKGVAIVESKKGIIVVAGRSKIFALPGGGADKGESRKKAATRELREETGLWSIKTEYLFNYKGHPWNDYKGRKVINDAKVFLIKANGRLRPRHEIKHVAHWKPGSNVRISRSTEGLIMKYLDMKMKIK